MTRDAAGGGTNSSTVSSGGTTRSVVPFALALLVVTGALAALGGDTPTPSYLGGAALAGLGAVAATRAGVPPVFWSAAALIGLLAVLSAARGQFFLAGPELAALIGAAGAFAVGAGAGGRTADAHRALQLVAWWFLLVLALSFVAHAADPDAVLGRPKPYHQGRLTGSFLSANTMATFSALALCVGVGGAARAARRSGGGVLRGIEAVGRQGLGAGLLVLFALACLLLTGSRAGLAAGLVSALALGVWESRAGRTAQHSTAQGSTAQGGAVRLWPLALLAAPILLLAFASSGVLGDRLGGVGTGGDGRLPLWRASAAAWLDAPLLGHGLGSFPRALAARVTPETAALLSVQNAAHNLPLQWLVQTGVLGTLAGLAVLCHLGATLRAGLARRRRARSVLRIGAACLGAALLHGLVDYAVEVPAVLWTLCLLLGLAGGAAHGATAVTDRRRALRS